MLVLRDAFDLPFAEIAAIVERSEDNCRQILSRARRRIEDDRPRFDADPAERDRLAARFLAAAREGDLAGLVAILAADAVLVGDGGGRARSIPRPMHGAAGDRAGPRGVLRPDRRVGPDARVRSRSTGSPASAASTATGAS